jgi:hypothetical protein
MGVSARDFKRLAVGVRGVLRVGRVGECRVSGKSTGGKGGELIPTLQLTVVAARKAKTSAARRNAH